MADKYAVNYDDEKLTNIQNEQVQKEAELTQSYDNMINNSDQYYNAQIEASKEWANKQSEIQQANTDFAIEKIEQQKEQANKDYTKEQKGAYADYAKQTSDYSVNAEQMAEAGLNNTGYSETSKVSMYNTYQNRITTARESYNQAVLNYNNSIKEAQLANNSALAQIAAEALQQQLELSLQGFQYKNTLIQTKQEQLANVSEMYNQRYQQMLSQINDELNRNMQYDTWKAEFDESNKQWQKEFEAQQQQWEKELAIQQQQWEKEYALEKQKYLLSAQQAAASASANSYTVKENTPTQLSATAQDIAKSFGALISNSPTAKVKQKAVDSLVTLRDKNVISTNELYLILDQLGLE